MSMTQIDPTAGGSAARSTRGRTPVWHPRLRGEDFDVDVNEMTMTLTEGQHHAATLTCVSETLENTDDFVDAPISFYWGVAPRTEPFYGYVTDVSEEQQSHGSLSFKLSLLGATKVMFEATPRFWTNKTATSAARDLCAFNRLGFGGHDAPFVWSSLAQTEESDWTMLRKLARRCGYALFVRYGVVLFYDPLRLYQESGSYTSLISGLDDLGSTDRNMINFEAHTSADVLQGNLGTRIGYFTTSDTVQVTKQIGEYRGYLFETDLTVRNQSEADEYMKSLDRSMQTWSENGIARIWGDADIFPGMVVDVQTSRTGRYGKTDGRWLVRSVGHQADRQQFQTILFLTRDKKHIATDDTVYRPFWDDEATGSRPKPKVTLAEEEWISSWRATAL